MTEYIGDKLFHGPRRPCSLLGTQGLMSRNRLFTARVVPGHGFAIEREGQFVKRLGTLRQKNSLSGCACVAGWNEAPIGTSPDYMFGDPNWLHRLDGPTTLLMLHDNGDLTISDKNGTQWRSETDVLDVPLSQYKVKDQQYDPISTAPASMVFDSRTVVNPTAVEQVHEAELSWEEHESVEVKFDHSSEWSIGSKVSVEVGIPYFNAAKGKVEISGSYGQSVTTGQATTVAKTVGVKQKIKIIAPPHSKVTAASTGSMLKVQGLRFTANMEITYADKSVETFPTSGTIDSGGVYSNYTITYQQEDLNSNSNSVMSLAAKNVVEEQPVERQEIVREPVDLSNGN